MQFAAASRKVHAKADSGSLDGMDDLERLVAILVGERDVLKRLSTWPWQADTLRGFLSSIALPILVWIITNLLGRVIGA